MSEEGSSLGFIDIGGAVLGYADAARRTAPRAPDTDDDAQLRAKAGAAVAAGTDGPDFYQYGMLTDSDLDRIATATAME